MMKIPMLAGRLQYSVRAPIFGAVLAILFLLAFGADPMLAEEAPGSGTVPPLARFIYLASPSSVAQGEVVTYELTIVNTDTQYVNVVLGLTATLPAGVVAAPGTLQANLGEARITQNGSVTWTGEIQAAGDILISFQAHVDKYTCGEKISRAVLYEIENQGAGGASPKQLSNEARFSVEGECMVYLPGVSKPLSLLPTLQNWNFEEGAAAPGWGQFDNDAPSTLIYSTDRKPLPMPQGGKWFGWLGGVLNKTSELRQQQKITLPADHSGIELRFLYMIESSDDCGLDKDYGYMLLNGVSIGAIPLCKDHASNTWQPARIEVPSTYFGKEVTLVLRSMTNATKNSNWFVDNVEFCSTDARAVETADCKKQ